MILKKCYVFSFGKLQDKIFDLTKGLNTFKEDNGWGKSTLATFIKAIFYGLNDSRKSVAENERIKYKTWNSTQKFGGFIEFEWGGKEFKLERYFGNKQSEDTVSLIDVATGKSYPNTENLGARIFQIDEEGFLSTTFFSQKDFQVKSNTSITAKFNSVCEIQDSDAFDKAVEKLQEKAKTYKKIGDKGLLSDVKREIFSVQEEIQRVNLSAKTAESLKVGVKTLENEVERLKNKASELTKRVTDAGKVEANLIKKEQYAEYKTKKQSYIEQKTQLDKILNGERPTEQELNLYLDCCNDLNKVCEREKILKVDIEALNVQEAPKHNNKSLIKPTIILLALAVLFCCVGVGLLFTDIFWLSITLFVLTAICGVGVAILKFVLNNKPVTAENPNNIFLEQKIKDFNEYGKIKVSYEQNINGFLSKFNTSKQDYFTSISEIISAVRNINLIEKELGLIEIKLAEFEQDKFLFEETDKIQNLTILKGELAECQDEFAKKANELAKKHADVKRYQDEADRISELEDKKTELIARQEQYKEDYAILLKTLEFLEKADENLKVKYRAPLQESLNKYLSLITDNKKKALIDIDLCVTVEENGGVKQPDYYSKGEQNLFEICKRFALTDVLFTGEKPFIILDDPFYNLDDDKLKQALELIKKLSEEYQILYFVCHESRRA